MPMRDSWPCDSASGLSLSMNSAGSCDSVISINSGYSDDSMEHLSAEERACLTFLEETIESLEAENDSGVSNDEQNHLSHNLTHKMDQLNSIRQVNSEALPVHDDPIKVLGKDYKSRKLLVPTPIVLANGNAKLLKKDINSTEQKTAILVNTPKTTTFHFHPSSALPTSAEGTATLAPVPGRHKPNAYSYNDLTDSPPSFIPEPPVKFNTSNGAKDNTLKNNLAPGSNQDQNSVSSDMPVVLLPPPSDFMDEPVLLPPVNSLPAGLNQPQTSTRPFSQPVFQFPSQQSESMPIAPPPGFDGHIGSNMPLTSLSGSPRGQLSLNELDKLRQKALMKVAPPVVQVKSAHNVPDHAISPTFSPNTSAVTSVEYVEQKSPPNVAPKPKKLPSSIVLKSHKDATPSHTLVSPGDRMMVNQQKVHQEALKKLGLLKTEEIDLGHCHSPPNKVSPQTSFKNSTSLPSPAERTTDSVLLYPEHHSIIEAEGKNDFSYLPVSPEQVERENLLITRASSPKPFELKSSSMERSGLGLKSLTLENPSYLPSQKENPENVPVSFGDQRNSQYQPALDGSLKDLSINQVSSETNREPELRKSLPISVPSLPKTEPQKSLRSHGISVVISPQNKNGEDRKQALMRLGLGMIKD